MDEGSSLNKETGIDTPRKLGKGRVGWGSAGLIGNN